MNRTAGTVYVIRCRSDDGASSPPPSGDITEPDRISATSSDTVIDVYPEQLDCDGISTHETAAQQAAGSGGDVSVTAGKRNGSLISATRAARRRSSVASTRGAADEQIFVVGDQPPAARNGDVVHVVGGPADDDVDGDADDNPYDGRRGRQEMSLDDAEDDEDGRGQAAAAGDADGCCADCCENWCRCCLGCVACSRRFGSEVSVGVDRSEGGRQGDARRKHPCDRRALWRWTQRLVPCTQWIPKYTLVAISIYYFSLHLMAFLRQS